MNLFETTIFLAGLKLQERYPVGWLKITTRKLLKRAYLESFQSNFF